MKNNRYKINEVSLTLATFPGKNHINTIYLIVVHPLWIRDEENLTLDTIKWQSSPKQ